MTQSEKETDVLIRQFLDIGEAMLCAGAEVNRVENTLCHLGRAYGAEQTSAFVITTNIILTLAFPDMPEITQTRRVLSPESTDFSKLERLNALSRRLMVSPLPADALHEEVQRIVSSSPAAWTLVLGSILASAGFAVFFGGTLFDALVSGCAAVLVFLMQRWLQPLCSNRLLFNFICSAVIGFLILGAVALFPVLNADKIMIGDIMLLIPGVLITNSVRNMMVGDTISGLEKLIESLFLAGAIAGGFMLAIWAAGGHLL